MANLNIYVHLGSRTQHLCTVVSKPLIQQRFIYIRLALQSMGVEASGAKKGLKSPGAAILSLHMYPLS